MIDFAPLEVLGVLSLRRECRHCARMASAPLASGATTQEPNGNGPSARRSAVPQMLFPNKNTSTWNKPFQPPLRRLPARAVIASRAFRFAFVDLFVGHHVSFFLRVAQTTNCLHIPSAESANFVMSAMTSALEEMRLQCIQALRYENCEEVQAALWFQTCEVAACQSCMVGTHGAKILQRHTRVPVSDRWKTHSPPKCLEHGEVLRYMCMTCDVVSCTDCMNFGLHKGHVHELVTVVADGHRSQLQEHMIAAEAADVARAHRRASSFFFLHVCLDGTDMCVAISVQTLCKKTLSHCGGICKVFSDF